jgi:chemotaxis protein MotB
MARKRPQAEHENHERWLVSYADFITLLFAFFVVMFASSQTDKAKAQEVSEAVKNALEKGRVKAAVHEILGGTIDRKGKGSAQLRGAGGAPKVAKDAKPDPKVNLQPEMQLLTDELQSDIKEGKLEIHMESRGLVVSLEQHAFFPSGEDTVDPETYPMLEKVAKVLARLPNSVRLEGHTDSVPIHTDRFASNWELSAARAVRVMELLTDRFGVPRQHFSVAGYAATAPVDTNGTPEGRAHNRRVDVVILYQEAGV